MKKHMVLTSVASLLTFASVAVLPAFAVDTGGVQRWDNKSWSSQKSEDASRHHGEHERYGKGEQRDRDDYRYGKGERRDRDDYRYGKGERRDRDDYRNAEYGKGGAKGHGSYGHRGSGSVGYEQGGYRGSRS